MRVLKSYNYKCKDIKSCKLLFKKIKDKKNQLIQIFSPLNRKENKKIIEYFNQYLPKSTLIAASTEEVIFNSKTGTEFMVISVIKFEKSYINDFYFKNNLTDRLNSINLENSKAIIILSAEKQLNGDQIVSALNKENLNIVLAGGYATSSSNLGYIFNKDGIHNTGSIAVVLAGENLKANWKYNLGWESISRKMEITKVDKQNVYQLDGRNIFDVYRMFLGEKINDKLATAAILKFPLLLEKDIELARCAKKRVGSGIEFSGELNQGDQVRISYGNLNKILRNSTQLYQNLDFEPEAALIYSCTGRSYYLDSNDSGLNSELKFIKKANIGFCTGGEYGAAEGKYYNLNNTTTVLYLSENCDEFRGENIAEEALIDLKTENLFYLSKKVISDLENINQKMRLANKKTEAKDYQKTAEEFFKLIFLDQKYTGAVVCEDSNQELKMYIEDSINLDIYHHLKSLWDHKRDYIYQRTNILGYQRMFIIYLNKEVEVQIIILSDEVDLFDIKENELFINQIPNYLKKAMLYEKLDKNIASLSTLEKTSDFLYSTLELNTLYCRIIDIVVGTMGMEASLLLVGEKSEVEIAEYKNLDINSDLFYFLKGRYDDILEKNQIIIENDLNLNQQFNSFIAIPIILDNYKGVLYAVQSKYQTLIDDSQKQFIRTLANQIRVSIKNALNHHKLQKLAVTDGLTKLYNHRYFHNLVKTKDNNYSIAILDIDDFKSFNDNFGHQAGDEILRQLSKLLKEEVRENDLVARYGGEEFIIYLNLSDKIVLKSLLKRLLEKIRNKVIKFEKKKFQITVSIGAAINNNKKDTQKIIKEADTALYIAKGLGKNQIKIYQE